MTQLGHITGNKINYIDKMTQACNKQSEMNVSKCESVYSGILACGYKLYWIDLVPLYLTLSQVLLAS